MLEKNLAKSWSGKKVLIIGAARQGLALARFLSENGAKVILNDRRQEGDLPVARNSLDELQIELAFGGHPINLLEGVDLVCPSGGVSLSLPLVQEALRRGVPLSNDSQIFLEINPCPVIGITGSAGKTTSATVLSRMLEAEVARIKNPSPQTTSDGSMNTSSLKADSKIWLGGNIGQPLITSVNSMKPEDIAVMELSSFQLELMTISPDVAVVLNVTPNHLDRHRTMENYRSAKARILKFQKGNDWAVLGRDDQGSWSMVELVQGFLVSFGLSETNSYQPGTFMRGNDLILRGTDNTDTVLMSRKDVGLRGTHNLQNVLAACAVSYVVGVSSLAMREGIVGFQGIPHRLEFVRTWGGAMWINDSIATSPDRAIAAIRSFEEPIILLAGGKDKNLPWEELVSIIQQRVDYVILFGESVEKIHQIYSDHKNNIGQEQKIRSKVICRRNLQEAVEAATQVVFPGSVVLLSPGGTSYDEFSDFEERGEAFRQCVMQLQ
jgi:UDP-N-acetylmuramoylalanine--D-glutamate ligase